MIIYSEVLAANFEPGICILCDSNLLNLENLEVENDTSKAMHTLGNLYPRQPVDPDASMMKNTWTDQNNACMAQFVSTIETDHVKSKNQDKEGILDDLHPLILLNRSGVKPSTNAQNAQVELSLLCAGGEPDP